MDFLGYAYMALGFVVFVIAIGIGASVLSGIQSGQTAASAAYNVTGYGLTGITNLANQSGNIGLILGAVIIIGLLLSAFMVSRK